MPEPPPRPAATKVFPCAAKRFYSLPGIAGALSVPDHTPPPSGPGRFRKALAHGMTAPHSPSPAKAITLILSAILCFSVMDACVKAVSPNIGTVPALWARYAGQMVVVLALVAPRLRAVAHTEFLGMQLARSVLLLSATALFFQGLSRIGLAEAAAVMILNPLFITLGAALFLGEKIGVRRIGAIAVAFCGAMLIIQPGTAAFQPAALFPLGAAICFSGYALITRRVGRSEDAWTSLFYTALVGGVVTSAMVPALWQTPGPRDAGLMGLIALVGTGGQLLLIRAYTMAPAATLAPFGYSGVVFASLIGLVVFAEVPTATTISGALVIVLAGLYVWLRETRPARS